YTRAGKWRKSEMMVEQLKKLVVNAGNAEMLKSFDASLQVDSISKILLTLLLLALAGVFFYNFFSQSKHTDAEFADKHTFRFSEVFLLSAAVSCLLWALFYACS